MTANLSKELQKLSNKVVYSQISLSEYYTIGCIKVRFSDHLATDMDGDLAIFSNKVNDHTTYVVIPLVGTNKEVQWFTNVSSVIEFVIKFESIARLLIKSPTSPNLTTDDEKANNAFINSMAETTSNIASDDKSSKVRLDTWKKRLGPLYSCQKGTLTAILDEIYRLSGTDNIMCQVMRSNVLPFDEKAMFLNKVLDIVKEGKNEVA